MRLSTLERLLRSGGSQRLLVHVIGELSRQITSLETALTSSFEQHADAAIVESLPGLGPVLGARTPRRVW